eukprot:TRINITY_DN3831_c0_g1_i4.p1 TRINITY_DN3831_c0_g1~~TRINITY_DN3831_c0_g1_i4.p1  ORF type:complete len:201 (-),score=24.59 TRINITY_DN3831_c0_g1_i4:27-629(-)
MDCSMAHTAPYFGHYSFELLFHDITNMPTEAKDEQQVNKKRHVGNDMVHIVWSEHTRDYEPTTIVSQFNDAHIVIYPREDGLFRIQIFKKGRIGLFGPLQDGAVVPKRLLSILVRQSVVHVNRLVRTSQPGYAPPFTARRRYIEVWCLVCCARCIVWVLGVVETVLHGAQPTKQEIAEKFAVDKFDDSFLGTLLHGWIRG